MAEIDEMFVSAVIFLFILLLFYIKFGKKIAAGERFNSIRKAIFSGIGKFGGDKKIKWSWGGAIKVAIAILVVGYIGAYLATEYALPKIIFSFNSSKSLENWKDISGDWTANGCLYGQGELQFKNPAMLAGARKIEFVPCGANNLDGLSFDNGEINSKYYIKSAVEAAKGTTSSYHIASMYYSGSTLSSYISSASDEEIKPGSVNSAPVGFKVVPWWYIMEQKYIVYVKLDNEPIGERPIAYSQGISGVEIKTNEKFSIKNAGGGIKEIRIFYGII